VLPPGQSLEGYLESPENAEKLMDFLARRPDILDGFPDDLSLLGAGGGDELTLGGGFFVNETKELILAARERLKDPTVQTVIMGHTHEAVDRPKGVRYLNTGCWTRYYRFRPDEPLRKWSLLRSPASYALFPYQLNYALVQAGNATSGQLEKFRERSHDQHAQA
jgi:hypothetical protein